MNDTIDNDKIRILVIGDLMLDHYIYGVCNRISPEAPVQIVEISNEEYTLGGAGNVLKNLKAFNAIAGIIAIVGADENGILVNQKLNDNKVGTSGIITDSTRATTIKSRVLASNHQLIRLDREHKHPIDESIEKKLINILEGEIKNYDLILLSDYDKGLLTYSLLSKIFALCRKAGVKTIVDPKGADFSKYKGANIIKPNKKEAIIASGINIADRESLRIACEKIKTITECDEVVITMSEDGIAVFSESKLSVIPTKAIDVVDVTGAGDTVLASLGLALASKKTLYEACDFANHAAAIVVSKVGSATATLQEIEEKYQNN